MPVNTNCAAVAVSGLHFFVTVVAAAVVAEIDVQLVVDLPANGEAVRMNEEICGLTTRLPVVLITDIKVIGDAVRLVIPVEPSLMREIDLVRPER